NWNSSVVQDFPDVLENYDAMPGVSYSVDDVPLDSFAINNGWSAYAVLSNDGTGSVLIDQDGQAHVWFGRMYVGDENFTDTTTFYYPVCDGIFHWEESDGPNNLQLITGVLDYDGDGFIGVTSNSEIAQYGGSGLTSFPVSGIDDQGNLYMAYAGLHELYRSGSAADKDQFYRHIYLQRSSDGGTTWSLPYDITNAPYIEAELVPFTEAMWPALPRHIGSNIWVLYQGDYFPGSTIWGNNHAAAQTDIRFVEVEKDSLGAVNVFEPTAPAFEVAISPNPTSDEVRIMANTSDAQPCLVEVFDFTGRKVQEQRFAGQNSMNLRVAYLPTGVYQVRVSQGQQFGITRLVKE
ncbi:MAG: T9SS type A sorting domain-containing protein, partial [Saprospiraceae bacterium]|nr:T9SS type A sorting domain-containing protein [Saprospiraceae bacterium]